jgi:hypothetical protein
MVRKHQTRNLELPGSMLRIVPERLSRRYTRKIVRPRISRTRKITTNT